MKNMKEIISFLSCAALLGLNTVSAQESEITYNTHVAQIINENCVVCHQEGGIGPMQFQNYDQVRPWAPLISFKVANKEMPPYAYDDGIGIQHLIGDWRLKQDEIDQIVAWVEQGAPLGDPDSSPPAFQLKDPNEWNFVAELGQPDMIVPSMSYDIPASGNDLWSTEIVDPGITADRCIKAVQVKPRGDAAAVVHHAAHLVLRLQEPAAAVAQLERAGVAAAAAAAGHLELQEPPAVVAPAAVAHHAAHLQELQQGAAAVAVAAAELERPGVAVLHHLVGQPGRLHQVLA